MIFTGPYDWPERHQLKENGTYEGECILCRNKYVGPKHSSHCWKCMKATEKSGSRFHYGSNF